MRYLLIIFLFVSNAGLSQRLILVLDKTNKQPIPYVTIYDSLRNYGMHTNEKGEFEINCKESILQISHISYQKIKINCFTLSDTILLNPNDILLNEVSVTAKKSNAKLRKKNLITVGNFDGKRKLQYSRIKEAALFIENPLKTKSYIYQLLFSFSRVKINEEGRVANQDILVSINIYEKSKSKFEPGESLLNNYQTYILKSGSNKLIIDLNSNPIPFPANGGFISVEFLGYYIDDKFIPLQSDDINIEKQFAPDLSAGHEVQNSFYRKTFSEDWSIVQFDVDGFYNFNFGAKLITKLNN